MAHSGLTGLSAPGKLCRPVDYSQWIQSLWHSTAWAYRAAARLAKYIFPDPRRRIGQVEYTEQPLAAPPPKTPLLTLEASSTLVLWLLENLSLNVLELKFSSTKVRITLPTFPCHLKGMPWSWGKEFQGQHFQLERKMFITRITLQSI